MALQRLAERLAYLALALLLLVLGWQALSALAPALPSAAQVAGALAERLSHPLYDQGPNDKGIGLQLAASLLRVLAGFALGGLVAIPLGVVMGLSPRLYALLNPLVQLLRPVSPLAWFPVGLAALQNSHQAAVLTIALTSLWPALINTMAGVAALPQDYRNVARVYAFPFRTYLLRVVLPYSLPHILTGLRIGLGTAWMVIVATEMLAGGTGIGFFVWDSYNSGRLEYVLAAILLIGGVGLLLDAVFARLIRVLRY